MSAVHVLQHPAVACQSFEHHLRPVDLQWNAQMVQPPVTLQNPIRADVTAAFGLIDGAQSAVGSLRQRDRHQATFTAIGIGLRKQFAIGEL